MKKSKMVIISILLVVLALILLLPACTKATTASTPVTEKTTTTATTAPVKPIELSYATHEPASDPGVIVALDWMHKIEQETNGRVHFTTYFGGTVLGNNSYDDLAKGVADIGKATLGYVTSGYDIGKAVMLFAYDSPDMETMLRICHEIWAKFPEVAAEGAKVKYLAFRPMPAYNLMMAKKAINNVGDIKGLSIKGTLTTIDFINSLGGQGIGTPAPEMYVNLQKGILDGALHSFTVVPVFQLQEVIKYVTLLNIYPWPSIDYAINWDSWNKLPPDIQKIFTDSTSWWEQELIKADKASMTSGESMLKGVGAQFVELPPEELNKFYDAIAPVNTKIMKELDAKGLPGTEIYNEVRRMVKEFGSK